MKNGKKGLNDIDYKKYEKKNQLEFLKEKDEVIKEINKFLKEANDFYKDYGELNKATSDDINNFVERFNKLAMPAKELTVFMRCLMKAFENSSSSFNDFKDKKKIDEALQKIKEPINEFYGKSKNLENLLDSIKSIKVERINEMMEISKKIKEKINKLEASSKKISEKIKKIRDKYGEPEEKLEVVDIGAPAPVNSKIASNQMEKEGKNLGEKTDINLKDIKEDIDKIKNQTRLDLLFIMDITNSMDAYLNQVKQDILEMISTIQTACAGIDIFLGFIGYRDFNFLFMSSKIR